VHRVTGSASFQQQLSDLVGDERVESEIRRLFLTHFADNEKAELDEESARTTDDSTESSASPAESQLFVDATSTQVNHAAALDPNPLAPQSRMGNYGALLMPTQLPPVPQLSQQSYRVPHSQQADSGFVDEWVQESPFGTSPNTLQQFPFISVPFSYSMNGAYQEYAASTPGMTMPQAARHSRQERNHSTPGYIGGTHNTHMPDTRYDGTRNHMRPENGAWGSDFGPHDIPSVSHAHWRADSGFQGQNELYQFRNSFSPQGPMDPTDDDAIE
jgi:hypothetical protein